MIIIEATQKIGDSLKKKISQNTKIMALIG